MILKIGHIVSWLMMSTILCILGSCVNDNMADCPDDIVTENTLLLHISKLDAITPAEDGLKSEMIKSLRIIVLSGNYIEYNDYIDLSVSFSENFTYNYIRKVKPGEKKFYLIANEESVSDLKSETGIELPAGVTTLTSLLDNEMFKSQPILDIDDDSGNAGKLESILNSINFNPDYKEMESDKYPYIYLPYSAYYDGPTIDKDATPEMFYKSIYLVPVAAKFIFNFVNERVDPVRINGISMSYANNSNYLFAQVEGEDVEKELSDKSYYWIDWLAEISQQSQKYPDFSDNTEFNRDYGWISDYRVPNPDDTSEFIFIEKDSQDIITVPGVTYKIQNNETEPGTKSSPIFYVPESINYVNPNNTETVDEETDGNKSKEQFYYLTMYLEDVGGSTPPKFENVAIPNLYSLFRNTYVIINLKMSEGDMEIYAEITPWNPKWTNGWISEGDAPGNNPFSK